MRAICVSTDVFAKIWSIRENGEENEDDILRRVLGCIVAVDKKPSGRNTKIQSATIKVIDASAAKNARPGTHRAIMLAHIAKCDGMTVRDCITAFNTPPKGVSKKQHMRKIQDIMTTKSFQTAAQKGLIAPVSETHMPPANA